MTFWLIAAGLLLLAVIIVFFPLMRRSVVINDNNQLDSNKRIYRERQAEINASYSAGDVTEQEQQSLLAELDLNFVSENAGLQPAVIGAASNGSMLTLLFSGLLVAGSYFLYQQWGAWDDYLLKDKVEQLQAMAPGLPREESGALIKDSDASRAFILSLDNIEADLSESSYTRDSAEVGYILGHYYQQLGKPEQAIAVYQRMLLDLGERADVLSLYLQAMYFTDREFSSRVLKTLKRTLAVDANNALALELSGIAAFYGEQYAVALDYLRKALATGVGGNRARFIREEIATVKTALAEANNGVLPAEFDSTADTAQAIMVELSIDPVLKAQLDGDYTVFLLARAPGVKMPVAVVKTRLSKLPQTLMLDDSVAMVETNKISNTPQLEVVARLSKRGDAVASAGDFQGVSELISNRHEGALALQINQVVGAANTVAKPVALNPVAPPVSTVSRAKVAVEVALSEDLRQRFKPDTTVFVFARAAGGRMPLAMRRLTLADLPLALELDDSMAMRPGSDISSVDNIDVVARISASGSAMASANDVEALASNLLWRDLSEAVKLRLQQP